MWSHGKIQGEEDGKTKIYSQSKVSAKETEKYDLKIKIENE